MENSKFKVGDNVQLVSGGPQMTVKEYSNSNTVLCEWFAKDDFKKHTFDEQQLKLYKKPSIKIRSI
jgi:uncharacterized protein YodC (DUF2158 family)